MLEGYRSDLRTEMSEFDPARAKALLDIYGYVDRNGDGWREQPDGKPLAARDGDAVRPGLAPARRVVEEGHGRARPARRDEDGAVAGEPQVGARRQIHDVASRDAGLDPRRSGPLERAYGGSVGKGNIARFRLAAFDKLYEELTLLPSGPRRQSGLRPDGRAVGGLCALPDRNAPIFTDMGYGGSPAIDGRRSGSIGGSTSTSTPAPQRRRRHETSRPRSAAAPLAARRAGAADAGAARSAAPVPRCCATPSPAAETGFDPAASATSIRASSPPTCSRRCIATTISRGRPKVVPHDGRGDAGDRRRFPPLDDPRSGPASISPTTRPSRASRASSSRDDYIYSWKRFFDPVNKSPSYTGLHEEGVLGVQALRDAALKNKRPFDYDSAVEGLRALDRYTLQFRLAKPRPRVPLHDRRSAASIGAVAREVVEQYGERVGEHPVGTGPFRLVEWRRSSLIVLERNPDYRDVRYDGEPAARRRRGPGDAAALQGPAAADDRPRRDLDHRGKPAALAVVPERRDRSRRRVPLEFAEQAVPGGKLAPYLAKRGVRMDRYATPPIARSTTSTWTIRWSAA